ncbi:MAG: bacterioferritin [Bradymonadia bacterium]|jgi:bacterioferritin
MTQPLVDLLNEALAWELRAQIQYSHYAAYVRGIHRLHLQPHFAGEATESMTHAQQVRDAIVKLGGEATRVAASDHFEHTTDYRVMLREALKTEEKAAATYHVILQTIEGDDEMLDVIQQISFEEERAVEELKLLID